MREQVTRRATLRRLAAGALAPALLPKSARAAEDVGAGQPEGLCVLFPRAVEGPYYFDPELARPDIAEDRPGVPVELRLGVVDIAGCRPIVNARVDVWHADGLGIYSGYAGQGEDRSISTEGQSFLRGTQMTDAGGGVVFRTIFPGWYPGRAPHMHVKVLLDATSLVTGQIYFPDALSARLYRQHAPYSTRPVADTTNAADGFFLTGGPDGGGAIAAIEALPEAIVATLLVAVDRTGAAARGGWRGFVRRLVGW